MSSRTSSRSTRTTVPVTIAPSSTETRVASMASAKLPPRSSSTIWRGGEPLSNPSSGVGRGGGRGAGGGGGAGGGEVVGWGDWTSDTNWSAFFGDRGMIGDTPATRHGNRRQGAPPGATGKGSSPPRAAATGGDGYSTRLGRPRCHGRRATSRYSGDPTVGASRPYAPGVTDQIATTASQ